MLTDAEFARSLRPARAPRRPASRPPRASARCTPSTRRSRHEDPHGLPRAAVSARIGPSRRHYHVLEETLKRHDVTVLSLGTAADAAAFDECFGARVVAARVRANSRRRAVNALRCGWYLATGRSDFHRLRRRAFQRALDSLDPGQLRPRLLLDDDARLLPAAGGAAAGRRQPQHRARQPRARVARDAASVAARLLSPAGAVHPARRAGLRLAVLDRLHDLRTRSRAARRGSRRACRCRSCRTASTWRSIAVPPMRRRSRGRCCSPVS